MKQFNFCDVHNRHAQCLYIYCVKKNLKDLKIVRNMNSNLSTFHELWANDNIGFLISIDCRFICVCYLRNDILRSLLFERVFCDFITFKMKRVTFVSYLIQEQEQIFLIQNNIFNSELRKSNRISSINDKIIRLDFC
jgi:hypothetical protein